MLTPGGAYKRSVYESVSIRAHQWEIKVVSDDRQAQATRVRFRVIREIRGQKTNHPEAARAQRLANFVLFVNFV